MFDVLITVLRYVMMSLAIEKYLFLRGVGEVIFLTIYGSLFGKQCYSIVK